MRKLNVEALLSRGEIPANVSDYYDAKELEELKNRK